MAKQIELFSEELNKVLAKYPEIQYILLASHKNPEIESESGQLHAIKGDGRGVTRLLAFALNESTFRDCLAQAVQIIDMAKNHPHEHDDNGNCIKDKPDENSPVN